MINIRILYTTLLFFILPYLLFAQKGIERQKIKAVSKTAIQIPEPSDICLSLSGKGFYIVSDNGLLFETDEMGKTLKKSSFKGADFEAVWTAEDKIYVSDESLRKIHIFNNALEHQSSHTFLLSGARNEGVEAGTYDNVLKKHYLFAEKNPASLMIFPLELNTSTNQTINFDGISEVSACTFYNGKLWILSDENRTVYQTDYPNRRKIIRKYVLPVHNPEGLCFITDNKFAVISDDMHKLYFFEINAD